VRLCIADPPYPPQVSERHDGLAPRLITRSRSRRWYGDGPRDRGSAGPADFHPDAGEWDALERHRALLEQLHADFDGWAIATTPDGLDAYRPLPVPAQVLVWVKPNATPTARAIASTWEAVIVCPPIGRRARRPGEPPVPDVLVAASPRRSFAGAKPPEWTRWVLAALDYRPGEDELVDLFPGSGAVAAAADGMLI
jgi:hypothetical protein